jgi:hypothetical protein
LDTADGTQTAAAVDARTKNAKPWDFTICPDQPSSKKAVGQELPFARSHVGIYKRQGLTMTGAVHPVYEEPIDLGKCPNYDRSKQAVDVIPKSAAASTPPGGTTPAETQAKESLVLIPPHPHSR